MTYNHEEPHLPEESKEQLKGCYNHILKKKGKKNTTVTQLKLCGTITKLCQNRYSKVVIGSLKGRWEIV